jgi:hypothetical protein
VLEWDKTGGLTLIGSDDDQGSLLGIDAEILVRMAVALVVTFVVVVDFVEIC